MIQNVLPAAVVVKFSPGKRAVLQRKRRPHVLQLEGSIPRSTHQRCIIAFAYSQIGEDLLQKYIGRLIPAAIYLISFVLFRIFLDVDI